MRVIELSGVFNGAILEYCPSLITLTRQVVEAEYGDTIYLCTCMHVQLNYCDVHSPGESGYFLRISIYLLLFNLHFSP